MSRGPGSGGALRRRAGSALHWPVLLLAGACAGHGRPAPAGPLVPLEHRYEQLRYWDDQARLIASLVSDHTPLGLGSAEVQDSLERTRRAFGAAVHALDTAALASADRPVLAVMQQAWREGLDGGGDRPTGPGDSLDALTDRVYHDYGQAARAIVIDGDTLNRVAILGRLAREPDREARRRLFLSLEVVWRQINGDDGPESPYRRLLQLRRAAWVDHPSPIETKAPALGVTTATVEQWLVAALTAWRAGMPDSLLEPWDWYYQAGEASRLLSPRVPAVTDLLRVNQAFYASLGASPDSLRIHYDLRPRPGKDPVAFTDFGSRRRTASGRVLPAEPWVFTAYLDGGFDNLAELLHETGHGIHLAAIRARPALNDWPDQDTFTEALADIAAMEVYQPAFQRRFLGASATTEASLRARYAGIVLDMAWALFEIRIHREPTLDPNRLWSDITSTWLGIVPHPEWSWWAMRGQLIDAPGYLVNYALGAFITADLRARAASLGHPVTADHPALYRWLAGALYRFGRARSSRDVLERFLGRPVEPDALLTDLRRLAPTGGPS